MRTGGVSIHEIQIDDTHDGRLVKVSYITIVRRRNNILELLPSEDIDCDEVALGVTVLPSLRSRHFDNL